MKSLMYLYSAMHNLYPDRDTLKVMLRCCFFRFHVEAGR